MSGRGGGRSGPNSGGRGRGRGRQQSSQPPSQPAGGRGNAGRSGPSGSAPLVSQSARKFENLSIGSSAPVPAAARVTQQPSMPKPGTPAVVTQQQVAETPPPPQAVPLIPSSSKHLSTPARPGTGTLGRKCVIKANHFLVDLGDKDPYQYDVTIVPEVTSKVKCREIMKFLIQSYSASHLGSMLLAFDGKKSAFAAGPLPFDSKEFAVKYTEPNGREKEFQVTIKFAAKKDLHHLKQFLDGRQRDIPQETIQALDVVLRESALNGREMVGRSLFSMEFGKGVLGDGVEYWKGFYQSLRPTQMGLSLNIDMSARAFYEPILVSDFVGEFLKKDISRPLSDQERIKVKRALRVVRVEVRRENYMRRYKVQGITPQPVNQLTFVDETGATKTVVQYFREKYNINLRFPNLPAIQAGNDAKPTYLPMEVCWLPSGQRYPLKLNEKQVTNLLRATCQRPKDREESIMKTLQSNEYNKDRLVNKDFGMRVREQLTSIDARVLPPPPLRYHESGRSSEVNPSVGQWNMIDLKVVNGGTVNYWTIINFSRQNENNVGRFCHGLVSMCQSKGIVFNPQPLIPMSYASPNNIERALVDLQSRCNQQLAKVAPGNQLQMLFVILPEAKGSYERIKRVLETELGIVSQCCKPQHVMKLSNQYFENVSLKINVKVGGRNTVLSAAISNRLPYVTDRPTIIFGADVTHPQPGEDSSASIAAVVASMDWPQVTKYKALVSAQPHRQEIIQDLYTTSTDSKRGIIHGGLIRELLISFRKSTGHKPHRIIFYRDGVSEGQFNEVLLNEMDKIRKACVSLEENYMPPVTFIVVQKRHHTRFFPARHMDRGTTDRSGNILPGTVVDTKICHPTEFDFYLCSHAGIQGTSRPTHYHVLYDENKFTADGLQMLTNNLCYTYARCTRSVSIVPPAYYAHLAAFRARYYVAAGDLSDSDSRGQRATRDRVSEVNPLPVIHDNVKSVMFFC
ncbi:protein argonaute MEL1-like [Rutidosis leptorrhynchoides]|uniref:protein argonaute MEL1-like n=1 Tax=Rutidosis leptorrhynchoides TaxID=125765 RepID=UPI003A9A1497